MKRKWTPPEDNRRFIPIVEVIRMVGLTAVDLEERVEVGSFPASVQVGPKSRRWWKEDVVSWLAARDPADAGTSAPPRPRKGSFVNEAMLVTQAEPFDGSVKSSTALYRHSVKVADLATATSGVYFLWRGPKVVYVGQTRAGFSRIATHMASAMRFDAVSFVRCPLDQLATAERAYIDALLPEYNTDPITMAAKRRRPPGSKGP